LLWDALADLGIDADTSILPLLSDQTLSQPPADSLHGNELAFVPTKNNTSGCPTALSVNTLEASSNVDLHQYGTGVTNLEDALPLTVVRQLAEAETVPPGSEVYYVVIGDSSSLTINSEADHLLEENPAMEESNPHSVGQVEVSMLSSDQTTGKGSNEQTFSCSSCCDRFYSEVSLSTHCADYHTEVKCDLCDAVCIGVLNYIEHKTSRHSNATGTTSVGLARDGICRLCGTKFVTNQALKYHLYKHAGLRPYSCSVCMRTFRTPSTLKAHYLVQHSVSKHKCSVCGLHSSTSGKLKIHMRSHTLERPYACTRPTCHQSFKQRSALRLHQLTHNPSQCQFQCPRCAKYFPIRSKYRQHVSRAGGCRGSVQTSIIGRRRAQQPSTKDSTSLVSQSDRAIRAASNDAAK